MMITYRNIFILFQLLWLVVTVNSVLEHNIPLLVFMLFVEAIVFYSEIVSPTNG